MREVNVFRALLVSLSVITIGCSLEPAAPIRAPATPTLISTSRVPTRESPTETPSISPTPSVPPLTPTPTRVPYYNLGTVQRDIAFCSGGDLTLLMDIYFPNQPKSEPAPVIVSQSPYSGSLTGRGGVRYSELEELLRRGYIVASSDRRDVPKYKFPAPIEDAKCAVRYLRANAAAYHIDPNRIGAWGCSAGGWLAEMLALTDASAGLEGTGGFAEQSSRVQAAVSMDGAGVDFSDQPSGLKFYFGDISPQDPLIANVSSLTHISKDDPPFLLFVSEADNYVPAGQTKSDIQRLYDGLTAGGVPTTLVVVKGAGHCFAGAPDPSLPEIATMVGDFFDQNLK